MNLRAPQSFAHFGEAALTDVFDRASSISIASWMCPMTLPMTKRLRIPQVTSTVTTT